MAEHTPGPWIVRHDFRCADGTPTIGVAAARIGQQSGAVAWPHGTCEAQELANARLIAAAPELLDALKDAHPHIADDALRTRIGNAIAKAEGLTP